MIKQYFTLGTDRKHPHEFNLPTLSEYQKRSGRSVGWVSSFDNSFHVEHSYVKTNQWHYDQVFIQRLKSLRPITLIPDFLDYHCYWFSQRNLGSKEFINHIKFVILDKLESKPNLTSRVVQEWVEKKGRQVQIHYISQSDFAELKAGNKNRDIMFSYNYLFAECESGPQSLERFRVKIIIESSAKREYLRFTDTTKVICNEFQKQQGGFFTFDGNIFYEIEEMLQASDGDAQLTLKKMEEQKQTAPNIVINGSNNVVNLGNIENSIINITQQLNQAGQEEVANALRLLSEAISTSKGYTDESKEEILEHVQLLAEQALINENPKKGLIKSALKKIKEIVPTISQFSTISGQNISKILPVITEYFEKICNIIP